MKFIKKNLYKIFLTTFLVMAPFSMLYADGDACLPGDGKICNPISQSTITGFIQTLLEGVLKVGIPVVALAVIYCGFLFVAARGNSEKLTKAKDALLYTLIGAGVLLGSWTIAQLISNTVLSL